jgi:hypothetical protein
MEMRRELAFSTFLKLLEIPEPQKMATLRGFKRGGGFNYWRPLQALAPEVAVGALPLAGIQGRMAVLAKGHQRKYNESALLNLLKWVSRRKLTLRTRPEKIVKRFGSAGLHVRIEPELAFSMRGRDYLMHIWATNTPVLSEETLSMGWHFFRHAFAKTNHDNHQFLILDTVKDRVFGEVNMLDNAEEMLAMQRDVLDRIWASLEEPGTGTPKRIPPDDRPADFPG